MPNTPDNVFSRVSVDYAMRGGARISWELAHHFTAPEPYTYQLQVGSTGVNAATDWEDVGDPFTDAFFATDTEQRDFGKNLTAHYRIKLTDADNVVYLSQPAGGWGVLDHMGWCRVREMLRKLQLRNAKFTGTAGLLLKAKRHGDIPDPEDLDVAVTDFMTGDIVQSRLDSTYGNRFTGGYYPPVPFFMDLSPEQNKEETDDQLARGTVNDMTVRRGLCSAYPQLYSGDVWVAKDSDQRFYVDTVQVVAQWRNVPVYVSAELKLAPTSDIIYSIPVN